MLIRLALIALLTAAPQKISSGLPADAMTTPTACLAAVRNEVAKQQRSVQAAPPSITAAERMAGTRTGLARQCTARFDVTTVADVELASLIELYSLADQGERMTAAVDRALAAKTLSAANRALVLLQAVQNGLTEPVSDARNVRLEGVVTRLDALPDADAFDQKMTAHQRMGIFYKSVDLDT